MASILADLMLRLRANSADLQKGLETGSKSVNKFNKNTKATGKDTAKSFKSMQKSAGGAFSSIAGSMGSISPAASSALGGFQAMAVGAKTLNAALGPIGLIIGAIGIVVKALSSYFKGTVDGAEKFAGVMGFLKGVLTVVQDAFIQLGRWMVWAFENPQEAIKELWESIKKNIVNRWQGLIEFFKSSFSFMSNGFKALGSLIKSIFDKDAKADAQKYFDQMKDSLTDVGKAALKMSTGMDAEDVIKKSTAALANLNKVAQEAAALEVRRHQLLVAGITLTKDEADARRKISELIFISSDKENETLQARLDATREAGQLETQIANEKIKQAEEALAIQRETNALGESGVEDLQAEADLYATLQGLYKDRNNKVREIYNREEEIMGVVRAVGVENLNMTASAAQAEAKRLKEEAKAKEDAIKKEEEMRKAAVDSWNSYQTSKNEETEEGQLKNLKDKLDQGLILQQEYEARKSDITAEWSAKRQATETAAADHQKDLDNEATDQKMSNAEMAADFSMQLTDAVATMFEASKNKELQAAGNNTKKKEAIEKKYAKKQKSIAIVQAVINGALGITKSLAQLGPIAGGIAAALVAATTAAQIAVISSQSFATGGIVSGSSFTGDNVIARVNSGEMVLNSGQQAKLFALANGAGSASGAVQFKIEGTDLIGVLEKQVSINETY